MFLLYSKKFTNRLFYIAELILKEIMGLELQFSTDEDVFLNHEGPKLFYGNTSLEDAPFLQSTPLLFEKKIKEQPINVFDFENVKAFYKVGDTNSVMPFDIFASSFYLVSRYEEYLPSYTDEHSRYLPDNSLAWKNDFLGIPVVDIWVMHFKEKIKEIFPAIEIKDSTYTFQPTYDIDMAYSYKYKGFIRNTANIFSDMRSGEFSKIKRRVNVLLRRKPDPYDQYKWLEKLDKTHKLKPIYFFLVGNYGTYDKNISLEQFGLRKLIISLRDRATIGLHPSYMSIEEDSLAEEHANLGELIRDKITHSRQHYVRITFPKTYTKLAELDVMNDYSMGYARHIGFRAGIARPFHFYNLALEYKSQIRIHPFMIMDVTLKNYMELSPQKAIYETKLLEEQVRKVGGQFISIWHNSSLGESEWADWRHVYETIFNSAKA